MLDWWVDGSVDDERVLDDADSIVIDFESAPKLCSIEMDTGSDELITFTCCLRLRHVIRCFWDLTPTY